MAYRHYLSEHPRHLFRADTETDRVEVWSITDGWQPTILTVMQLDGLGGDAYYRVNPEDLERAKASMTD